MPELPEVEVLRRSLAPRLIGERIERVEVLDRRLREAVKPAEMTRLAAGRKVIALRRRAKYLLIDLDGGSTLVVHLGMSGRLTLAPAATEREPHEHLTFHLASGQRLRFRDPRRFGLAFCRASDQLATDRRFKGLGVEPLEAEFSGELLASKAAGRRGPVKTFLMNGAIVVGVGNIYASESLYRAGIHPARSVGRIAPARWARLAESVRSVLSQAIAEGGTTLNDFADGDGNEGYFQVSLSVYDREGQPCVRCGAPIRRIVQTGRSTYFCPKCQR